MRTALSPILIPLRCSSFSRPHTSLRCSLTVPLLHRQDIHDLTTTSSPSWSLKDLSRVSEARSALIFHLHSDSPYHNLSIEHYLLTHSHPRSKILLFYTNRPCVVIGRNQNPWLETDLKRLQDGLLSEEHGPTFQIENGPPVPIDLVRRRSGGGTVFHDWGNLNYSVIVPNSKSFKRSTHAEMVVRALSPLSSPTPVPYDFDEIRVNGRNDIVMKRQEKREWLKISGSAYKLTRGRALHHGTLLYASPYIKRISELLRSPGRDFIQAKGVESVRSKVGNLTSTVSSQERPKLKKEITEAIAREFWNMYGDNQTRHTGLNEVTLGPEEREVGGNPEIAAGVRELRSNAWRFMQTPRFSFSSGVLDGAEVSFQAHHGNLECLTLKLTSKDPQEVSFEWRRNPEDDVKLNEVNSWKELLDAVQRESKGSAASTLSDSTVQVPDALVARLEAVFPRFRV
ncbi:uncharacterized protein Z518_05923 [Rhinocladiella mackenziei CBS 650.93]|uniref:Putative lipoate-protein ligase A n=1 Tax=Rhinocladiella mackenziei CBS 650.93 TaxID=1442369 RepID=A0A0D2IPI7_9EURO|nr:uncharacterized protein Z518_05923 [Rhinocladiella mackenziei CBS 650.93]KIX05051.1 hypothetical protein Z518_05923 [Rhinocladiella mackenziei CBS 650.93]